MSYEGRVQVINKKGCLQTFDDSGGNNYQRRPDDAWINRIDDTTHICRTAMPFFTTPQYCDYCGSAHYFLTELLDGNMVCDLCLSDVMTEETYE